jgi:hypothetical protein
VGKGNKRVLDENNVVYDKSRRNLSLRERG